LEKKDIQAYLDENHLKYFADKSNFDTKITRNKLRLEILPKFEEINKNYKENISNLMNYLEQVKENIDEEVKRFLNLSISYNILFPTSRMKNLETKKKFYVISEKEEGKNPPNLFYQGGRCPLPLTSPYQGEEQDQIPPLNNGGVRGVFEISAFNELSTFMQKEVIRYIYFISN
jgi:hypothetical protein